MLRQRRAVRARRASGRAEISPAAAAFSLRRRPTFRRAGRGTKIHRPVFRWRFAHDREDRPPGRIVARSRRVEQLLIDAARPQPCAMKTARFEVGDDRRRRRQRELVAALWKWRSSAWVHRQRNAKACLDIFREAAVIGGGRAATGGAARHAVPASRAALRWRYAGGPGELVDPPCDLALRGQRQTDFRIARTGNRTKAERRNESGAMSLEFEFAASHLERANDAVDLRLPGVADDQDLHAATLALRSNSSTGCGSGRASCTARFSSRRPGRRRRAPRCCCGPAPGSGGSANA